MGQMSRKQFTWKNYVTYTFSPLLLNNVTNGFYSVSNNLQLNIYSNIAHKLPTFSENNPTIDQNVSQPE